MSLKNIEEILAGLQSGQVVPYLGPGALVGSVNVTTGTPIPADSDSLIFAMNNNQPMAPRLMYEFPRAAMHVELKRGRSFLSKFLTQLYGETQWSRAPLHEWIEKIRPHYVIDINRDTQLQDSYADIPHTMINGISRMAGTSYRFVIYNYDGQSYKEIDQNDVDPSLPILFKPMGTPRPDANYIVSDADYVDYITELMGGFAIPSFLKEYRKDKQYLLIGMRLTRDTERMVMSDITYAAGTPRGWALIPEATKKEQRYCERIGIDIIDAGVEELLAAINSESSSIETQQRALLANG